MIKTKSAFTVAVIALAFVMSVRVPAVQAITWGEVDASNEYPNVGAVVVLYEGTSVPIGSGTLIAPQTFLTAGHVVAFLDYLIETGQKDEDEIRISFDTDVSEESLLLTIDERIIHPDFSPYPAYGVTSDVGLLILDEPVTEVDPAILPEEGFLDDQKPLRRAVFTVVGYGGSLAWPPPTIDYQDQRQVVESEYRGLTSTWLRLSQHPKLELGGSCYGDSGGPIFWEHGDDRILVAITGWGDTNCISFSANFRIDIPGTLAFIDAHIV